MSYVKKIFSKIICKNKKNKIKKFFLIKIDTKKTKEIKIPLLNHFNKNFLTDI